ncbi:MAG: hypothetical protein COA38_14035 [Fluviicola sp.]|nr:MAG: hypothetical protein COA38_14035 [Fluviicola sp.]
MTKNFYYFHLLILILSAALFSCDKNPVPEFHHEYFGMEKGRYVVYDVIEISHDDNLNQHDTLIYQLKTYWADTFVDNQGRTAREFKRSVRLTENDPWILQDLWTGLIDGIRAELIEENQRVVKLVFAPTQNKNWDANAYNQYSEQNCFYRDIHSDTLIDNVTFDPTLVVEQEQFNSIIDSVHRYEMYAKDIGLIIKYERDLHYQINAQSQLYLNEGTECYYRFVSTGIE